MEVRSLKVQSLITATPARHGFSGRTMFSLPHGTLMSPADHLSPTRRLLAITGQRMARRLSRVCGGTPDRLTEREIIFTSPTRQTKSSILTQPKVLPSMHGSERRRRSFPTY